MDPVLELQAAIIARLRADTDVAAIVGPRVYDIPPAKAPLPLISIGPTGYQSHDITCMTSGNVMLQIDAWSEQRNLSEIRQLAEAIRSALRDWEPNLPTNALVTLDHWRTDYINEGEIQHASIRYNAIVEQPGATAHY